MNDNSQSWDDTLAYVAGFNARTCIYAHDPCHRTAAYPSAGQNIALENATGGYTDAATILSALIRKAWWGEYRYVQPDVIASMHGAGAGDGGGHDYGHFTVMANQRSDRVGCALVRWHRSTSAVYYTYLVCNYSYTNVNAEQVYEAGAPCSDCPTGTACSREYAGLCAETTAAT